MVSNQAKQIPLSNLYSYQVWISSLYCRHKTGYWNPDAGSDVLIEGKNKFHTTSALALEPIVQLASITTRAHCLSSRPPQPFSAKLLCLRDAQPIHLHGLLHPRWRTLHCLCRISSHICQAIPSSLSGTPWMTAWPPVQWLLPPIQCHHWHICWGSLLFQSSDC